MKTETLKKQKYILQGLDGNGKRDISELIDTEEDERCCIIEHNYRSCIEQSELEDKILRSLNNYDSLLSALKSVIDDVKDWRDYNDSQADSFEGNEKKMVQDIATDITDRLRKAKEAIKSAEQ